MQALSVTVYNQSRSFPSPATLTVGSDRRSTVVVDAAGVAGCHIVVRSEQDSWVAYDRSAAGMYLNGHPTSAVVVDHPVALRLGGLSGPEIGLAPGGAPGVAPPPQMFSPGSGAGPGVASTLRPVAVTARSLTDQLAALWRSAPSLSVLLPLRAWWESKEWRKGYPLFFLVFALAPYLIFAGVSSDSGIQPVAWAYIGIFSALWAILFFTLIRPGKLDLALGAEIAVASAIFGIPLAIWLETRLPGKDNLLHFIYAVGLPEEIAKAAPVFVIMVLLAKGRSYPTRMFMFMGGISGLAFGAVEGVKYVALYEKLLLAGQMSPTQFVRMLAMRFFTDSLFHGCTAIVSAYFVGLGARHRMWQVQLTAFGIGAMAVLHGINDRWASGWALVAIAATLLFIVVGYVQNADGIEAQVAAAVPPAPAPVSPVPVSPAAAGRLYVPERYERVG